MALMPGSRPGAPARARAVVPISADIPAIVAAAGGDIERATYDSGVLHVHGISQAALDAAVESHGDPTFSHREAKRLQAKRILERRLAAGMPWRGGTVQIDEASQARLATRAMAAQAGTMPEGLSWVMADNSRIPLDQAGMLALAAEALAYANALRTHYWDLRDIIAGAGTPEALASVDVDFGWPEPPAPGD